MPFARFAGMGLFALSLPVMPQQPQEATAPEEAVLPQEEETYAHTDCGNEREEA